MSLNSLMKHRVTIQQAEDAVQSDEGFIDYQGSWINKFVNIRCNLQYQTGRLVLAENAKLVEHNKVIIYYTRTDVWNYLQSTLAVRFIFWRDKFSSSLGVTELNLLTDNSNKNKFNIYIPKGNVNPTEGQEGTKRRLYYIQVEKTDRMNL